MAITAEQIDHSMTLAVVETLENLAFLEVYPAKEDSPELQETDALTASLLIHDPLQGELRLLMPQALASGICETVYNMSAEDLSAQMVNDTFAEIINIIAGRFMNEVLPGEQVYRLGLPEIDQLEALDSEIPSREWKFVVEEQPLSIIALGSNLLEGP